MQPSGGNCEQCNERAGRVRNFLISSAHIKLLISTLQMAKLSFMQIYNSHRPPPPGVEKDWGMVYYNMTQSTSFLTVLSTHKYIKS